MLIPGTFKSKINSLIVVDIATLTEDGQDSFRPNPYYYFKSIDSVFDLEVRNRRVDVDPVERTSHPDQRESLEVERDVAGRDDDAILPGDAGKRPRRNKVIITVFFADRP